MELDDCPGASHGQSPSLGQLLKYVRNVLKEATSDGGETPLHQVLDMSEVSLENSRSLPYVLSFANLTYNIKIRWKFSLSGMFTSQSNRLDAAMLSEPVGGESVFTRTNTLLNDISGKAREGEVLEVLRASGFSKPTLIDALTNCIAATEATEASPAESAAASRSESTSSMTRSSSSSMS